MFKYPLKVFGPPLGIERNELGRLLRHSEFDMQQKDGDALFPTEEGPDLWYPEGKQATFVQASLTQSSTQPATPPNTGDRYGLATWNLVRTQVWGSYAPALGNWVTNDDLSWGHVLFPNDTAPGGDAVFWSDCTSGSQPRVHAGHCLYMSTAQLSFNIQPFPGAFVRARTSGLIRSQCAYWCLPFEPFQKLRDYGVDRVRVTVQRERTPAATFQGYAGYACERFPAFASTFGPTHDECAPHAAVLQAQRVVYGACASELVGGVERGPLRQLLLGNYLEMGNVNPGIWPASDAVTDDTPATLPLAAGHTILYFAIIPDPLFWLPTDANPLPAYHPPHWAPPPLSFANQIQRAISVESSMAWFRHLELLDEDGNAMRTYSRS